MPGISTEQQPVYTTADVDLFTSRRDFTQTAAGLAKAAGAAAEVYLVGGEIIIRMTLAPVDFVWSINDVVEDPGSVLNWVGLVPYLGQGVKAFKFVVKDAKGVERILEVTEAEVKALAKGEASLVDDGAKLTVDTAGSGKACGTAASGAAAAANKSKRLEYMGRTPGKGSRTGREVIERMKAEGKLRHQGEAWEFLSATDHRWYPLEEADMSHKIDAVTWWNQTGRQYGAKAPEVREWMLDSSNYTLEHFRHNRSAGAKLGSTYLPPIPK